MSDTTRTTEATGPTTVPPLSEETHEVADRIVRRYPVARSALLPLLHLVQSEQNHITDEGITFCAEKVGLTRAEVGAVATFYTMYKREPVGDWLLSVCTNPPCKIAGGQEIYDNYVEALGGHSDPETKVTVEHAECLGICDGAPVVQVNYEMFGPMTVAEGDQLLASCRKGEPPVSPWSGEKPPTFAEVERDLSGANDAWEAELHKAALQQIAYDQPPTYRSGETDIPVTHPGGDPAGVGGAQFRDEASGPRPAAPGLDDTGRAGGAGAAGDAGDAEVALAGSGDQRIAPGEVDGSFTAAGAGDPLADEVEVHPADAPEHEVDLPPDAHAMTTQPGPGDQPGDVGVLADETPGQPDTGASAQDDEVRSGSAADDVQPASVRQDAEDAEGSESIEGDAEQRGEGYADAPDQADDSAAGAADETEDTDNLDTGDETDVAPGEASALAQSAGAGDPEGEPEADGVLSADDQRGAPEPADADDEEDA